MFLITVVEVKNLPAICKFLDSFNATCISINTHPTNLQAIRLPILPTLQLRIQLFTQSKVPIQPQAPASELTADLKRKWLRNKATGQLEVSSLLLP